jgi:hypothetical protein
MDSTGRAASGGAVPLPLPKLPFTFVSKPLSAFGDSEVLVISFGKALKIAQGALPFNFQPLFI